MREILFRGKPLGKIDEDFVYGSLGVISTDLVAIYQCEEYYEDIITLVDIGTVGQYTGLNDKNGKKIFEGDIVKTDKFSEPNKQYIIKYDLQFGAFIGQDKYNAYFVTFDGDSDQFEIIGNIHDCKAEDFLK